MFTLACACPARARTLAAWILVALALLATTPVRADTSLAREVADAAGLKGLIPVLTAGSVDTARLRQRDALEAKSLGDVRKDLRVAEGFSVLASPEREGLWLQLNDGSRLWLLAVEAPGASELHLGFDRFQLPDGAFLSLLSAHGDALGHGPDPRGQLWPGMLPGDRATLVLALPAGATLAPEAVRLSYVGGGYRHLFTAAEDISLKSSDDGCAVDIVCPLGDDYREPARAVARYTFRRNGYTYLCTGSMVANSSGNLDPLFLTAHHCVGDADVAATVVLYFNYQSTECGLRQADLPAAHSGGASLLASRADVDTSLLRLAQAPPPQLDVYYAGWDRSGETPAGSIGIDHPRGRVKSIVLNDQPLYTTNSCILGGTQSTHWRTSGYLAGATMPGSSGSMLLVPAGAAGGAGALITGVLSGGSSACVGGSPNLHGDCYGKLAVAWDGEAPSNRLRDWLDPIGAAPLQLQGYPGPRQPDILNSGFEG